MFTVPILLFGAVVLLACWMHVRLKRQGYRARCRPPSRSVAYSFDPANSVKLRGGARVGRLNATVPLVTLRVDHQWAHLSGLAPVWVSRAEVQRVRRIASGLGAGIMFDTVDGHLDGLIYWTFDPSGVLDAFGWYDWPVAET